VALEGGEDVFGLFIFALSNEEARTIG